MVKAITIFLCLLCSNILANQTIDHSKEIDRIIANDLKNKRIEMPLVVNPYIFVRRAYIDIVGRVPTYQEWRTFLKRPDRKKLIEDLQNTKGYTESMFNFYADLLRIKRRLSNNIDGDTYIAWVKQEIEKNTPYDQFVKKILTAEGNIWENPEVGYFLRDEGMLLDNVSNTFQAFAGMNISCAQCHDHPFDDWTQMDYYNMTAFFTQLNTRGKKEDRKEFQRLRKEAEELDKSGKQKGSTNRIGQFYRHGYQHTIVQDQDKKLKLPDDYDYRDAEPGEIVKAETAVGDRVKERRKREGLRVSFANWLASDTHPTFAANIVNRLWDRSFGFPLINNLNEVALFDEVKDGRNARLTEYLVKVIKEVDYDLKKFNSILYNTKFYQAKIDPENEFKGPVLRRMTSAQLWDSVVTLYQGDPDKWQPKDRKQDYIDLFTGLQSMSVDEALKKWNQYTKIRGSYYEGAPKIKGNLVIRSSHIFEGRNANFLREFGRSDRELIETGNELPNITQILNLMNGGVTQALQNTNGYVASQAKDMKRELGMNIIFISYIGRAPNDKERELLKDASYEDIIWILINSHEFKLIS
jgi:hypothetical protein